MPALAHRDRLTALDAVEQAEVGAREQADVLRVLAVDLLDVLGDDELHSARQLAVRRGLARAAAPLRRAAHDDAEAAVLDRVSFDLPAAEAHEAVPGERLVVVVANPPGGDLVGGDAADERLVTRLLRERFAGQLPFEGRLVFGEVQNAAANGDGALTHADRSTT
jgi:hypothetical protein